MEKSYYKAIAWTFASYISIILTTWGGSQFEQITVAESFGRAGAIMVLFGVIAESHIFIAWGGVTPIGAFPEEEDIPSDPDKHIEKVKRLRPFANISVLLGTLIWAYGDLIWIII